MLGAKTTQRAKRLGRLSLAVLLVCAPTSGVRAETLADAIALAYQSNPNLQSQRAQLRALDELYVQARAGYRPQVSVDVEGQFSEVRQRDQLGRRQVTENTIVRPQLSVRQPLYTGGRTTADVNAAELDVFAGRQTLRSAEASVLQSLIQAYADVLRDQRSLAIRQSELGVLQSQLDDARARFAAGEVTQTDVLQSSVQLEGARALVSAAQGQLQVSRASYAAIVGQNPGDLAPEPDLPGLPLTADQAFAVAETSSPTLLRAQLAEAASRQRVARAKANNFPTVQATTTFGYSGPFAPFALRDYDHALNVGVSITQPLFTGGLNSSVIRRALEFNTADRIGIETARRTVVQQVSQAWNIMLSRRASAVSNARQVETARLYFSNTREEYRIGQRSTLDVLVAEQTLRNAELSLSDARRDAFLAEAQLLAAMGRLEAAALVNDVETYDPAKSFNRVKRAGAVPWEGLIAAFDKIDAPGLAKPVPISAPPLPDGARGLQPVTGGPAVTAGPALLSPTEPFPNTTSPATR